MGERHRVDLYYIGIECYKLPLIIMACISFFGGVASLIFAMRTRKFYKSDIYKKFTKETPKTQMELSVYSVFDEE